MNFILQALYSLFALVLLGTSVLLLNALMRYASRPGFILRVYILTNAIVVFLSQVASIFHTITVPFLLFALVLLTVFSWLLWKKFGKPSLLGPFADGKWAIWREFPSFRSHPALYILAFGVVVIYLFGAGLIIALPQHNYDSMTYHLSRVGYWMQHQTLEPWATPNPRQTTTPVNAELGLLWVVLFWGTDQLAGFVQWFAALGIGIGIYALARMSGAKKSQGLFSSLVWSSFPQVLLQSTTTQNDLMASFFCIATLFFLFEGVKSNRYGSLIFSAISLGLAVGTKTTVLIALPGMGVAIILFLILRRKDVFQRLLIWGLLCIFFILLFGSYTYIQNEIFYGDPFSIPEWTAYVSSPSSDVSRLTLGCTNLVIYFSQFIDFSSLPGWISHSLEHIRSDILKWYLFESGVPVQVSKLYPSAAILNPSTVVHEDTTWFGPLAFIFLIPTTIYQFVSGIQKRDFIKITLVIIGVGFYLTLSFLFGWSPYRVRYFNLPVSILAPLMFPIYKQSKGRELLNIFIAAIALWIMVNTVLSNEGKPLIGENAVWGQDTREIRFSNNPKMLGVLEMVDEYVPGDATLGTRLGVDHWDYVLFGRKFSRTIVPLDPSYLGVDLNFIREKNIDYLLIAPRERPFLEIPSGLIWLDVESGWNLFQVSSHPEETIGDDVAQEMLGLYDQKRLLVVDKGFQGTVGLTELYTPAWDIETDDYGGFKWLGEGLEQGLSGFLWSNEEIPIRLNFSMEPGPSRADVERHLEIAYFPYGPYGATYEGAVVERVEINKQTTFELVISLQKGLNEFRVLCLDRATIPVLPNGDKRPLLVKLDSIEVLPFENSPDIMSITDDLESNLQIMEIFNAPWSLETFEGQLFYWLGEGSDQGYHGYIWSDKQLKAKLLLYLEPGPSRGDKERNLEFTLARYGNYWDSVPVRDIFRISGPDIIELEVDFYPGMNELELYVLDKANIDVLPNGDTRPLLVKLSGIDIFKADD